MLKTTYLPFLMIFLLSGYSCGECGKSIKLGEFELSQTSLSFFPYQGSEMLIFKDQSGFTHELTSPRGVETSETRLHTLTLCSDGMFDNQHEYYEIERRQIAFVDRTGKQIFYVDLKTSFEQADNRDSIAIYDLLYIDASLDGNTGQIQLITDERMNQVSNAHRHEYLHVSRFVGDTTLYGRSFEDVYEARGEPDKASYYNPTRGVIAFKIHADSFWVLEN